MEDLKDYAKDINVHRFHSNYYLERTENQRKEVQLKDKQKGRKLIMAANVETMFSTREKPWHGLGTIVEEAPASADALRLAGLDWNVVQKDIFTNHGKVDGYKANVRDTDNQVLGVVTDRYKVIQNVDAFAFTDELLGEGVRYETAGSLQGGKKVWLLARLPREYIISGERITPYLVFSNTHDGVVRFGLPLLRYVLCVIIRST